MRSESLFRVLFVVYCLEAGIFLTLAPWTDAWQRLVMLVPLATLRSLVALSAVRGLVSGFGVVHLVWAAHDIDLVLRGSSTHASRSQAARRQ